MIKRLTTECGMRVIMEKKPHMRSVGMSIMTATGSVNEDDSIAGISHVIEHMMFKGTGKRTAKNIAMDLDMIGASANAFTSKEMTCYHAKSISDRIPDLIDVLTDIVTNSTFEEEELEREKKVIYEEMNMIEDSPEDIGHDIITEQVFRGSAFESPIIGSRESVGGVTMDSLLDYMDKQYSKDSMLIAIAGNFEEDGVMEMLNGRFHKFRESKVGLTGLEEVTLPEPSYSVKKKDIEQAHIFLAMPAVPVTDELHMPLRVVNTVLGGSMSSRLFQHIREEKGLAYTVYSSMQSYRKTGMLEIYAGVSNDKIAETLNGIINELHLLKRCGIKTSEIDSAKTQIKSAYAFGSESAVGRMFYIGKNELMQGKVISESEFIDLVDSVNPEGIERAIEYITDIGKYSAVGVMGDKHDFNFSDVIA